MTGAPLDPPALEEGVVFAGRFRIERRRAVGGGARCTAWDVAEVGSGDGAAAEPRVLFVWPPAALADGVRDRFLDAVARGAAIEDGAVVRLVAGGIDDATGAPWIAKEPFAGGGPLPELVASSGRLDLATARRILERVGAALGAAHAHGTFLSELFADDVEVVRAPTGELAVKLDVGGALVVAALGERSVARTDARWRAPEASAKGTATADVWAYGMLARWVLGAPSADDEAPPSANVPAGFALWLSGATAREASLRFLSVADAWTALEPVLEGRGQPSFTAAPGPSPPIPGATRVSWVLAAVIFGSVAFVMFVAGFVFREPTEADAHGAVLPPPLPPRATASAAPAVSASSLAYDPLPPLVASTAAVPSVAPSPPDAIAVAVDGCLERGDLACVRHTLEPPVFGASATPSQAQMLYDLCDLDSDAACRAKVVARYATVDTTPGRRIVLPVGQPTGRFGDRRGLPGSVAQRARTLLAKDDAMGARALLAPRVFDRIATTEEVRLLFDVCGRLHDLSCQDEISSLYPGLRF